MSVLRFPDDPTDPIACADWLELSAFLSSEQDFGLANLERNLKRLGVYASRRQNTIEEDTRIESACSTVKGELNKRAQGSGAAYPFEIMADKLVCKGLNDESACYIFCLCLSWFGWKAKKGNKVFPRRMFEDLSKHAAARFLNGSAIRFGAPRTDLPSSFKEAVVKLALDIGEGKAKTIKGHVSAQDDTLDLIAWRDHPDRAEGKLMLVGQCASGNDWESKKRELDIDAFFDDWFEERPATLLKSMILAFFVPHRVPKTKWVRITRRAGIVFDRCRISYWATENSAFTDREQYKAWVTSTTSKVTVRPS